MEDALQKALGFSTFRKNIEVQKKTIKDKLHANLTIGYDGGIFYVDRPLIVFVDFLIKNSRVENIPILDINNNPINIKNVNDFQNKILDVYFDSTNEYLIEFDKIKSKRSPDDLLKL
jgi:hypothetical protein